MLLNCLYVYIIRVIGFNRSICLHFPVSDIAIVLPEGVHYVIVNVPAYAASALLGLETHSEYVISGSARA